MRESEYNQSHATIIFTKTNDEDPKLISEYQNENNYYLLAPRADNDNKPVRNFYATSRVTPPYLPSTGSENKNCTSDFLIISVIILIGMMIFNITYKFLFGGE